MLDDILRTKKRDVAAARASAPLAELRATSRDLPAPRDFLQAVAPGVGAPAPQDARSTSRLAPAPRPVALIAEIKRASPSKGVLNATLDPAALARTYAGAGACALSVLTDATFFRGAPEDLRAARGACALPVLRKDFTIDPYQVWEARAMGADAVLLIARILSRGQLQDLGGLAREIGLAVLYEIHQDDELPAVLDCRPRLVGVNGRNLETFAVSLEVCTRIGRALPKDAGRVAESGIGSREDVERMAACGYNAVLVGETLVRSGDPAATVRELLGARADEPPPFTAATASELDNLPPPPGAP